MAGGGAGPEERGGELCWPKGHRRDCLGGLAAPAIAHQGDERNEEEQGLGGGRRTRRIIALAATTQELEQDRRSPTGLMGGRGAPCRHRRSSARHEARSRAAKWRPVVLEAVGIAGRWWRAGRGLGDEVGPICGMIFLWRGRPAGVVASGVPRREDLSIEKRGDLRGRRRALARPRRPQDRPGCAAGKRPSLGRGLRASAGQRARPAGPDLCARRLPSFAEDAPRMRCPAGVWVR